MKTFFAYVSHNYNPTNIATVCLRSDLYPSPLVELELECFYFYRNTAKWRHCVKWLAKFNTKITVIAEKSVLH